MLNAIQRQINAWIASRTKPSGEVTLNQRRIYIFLSREGWLYGVLLLITFIAGINYANNLVLGLCFYLASVLVITIHFTYAQLSGLNIKLLDVADAEAGSHVLVRLQLAATGSKPHRQIRLAFPIAADDDVESDATSKKKTSEPKEEFQLLDSVLEPRIVEFYLPAGKRGKYKIPRLSISSVYPLGILKTWSYMRFDRGAWVWPKPLAFNQFGHDYDVATDADAVAMYRKGQDDFDKLDNYQAGESMARVSWQHLARGQGMLTKHFADPVGQDVMLDYANMPAQNHEAKLSQLSFAVQQLSQSLTPFTLKLPEAQLPQNAGSEHEKQALKLLAKSPKRLGQLAGESG